MSFFQECLILNKTRFYPKRVRGMETRLFYHNPLLTANITGPVGVAIRGEALGYMVKYEVGRGLLWSHICTTVISPDTID